MESKLKLTNEQSAQTTQSPQTPQQNAKITKIGKRKQEINSSAEIDPEILKIGVINQRIQKEVSHEIIKSLTDESLLPDYRKCTSVENKIQKLNLILDKYVNAEIKQKITEEYLLELIPSGTKGVIRGNKFNNIIKNHIQELKLSPEKFEICFEKNCELYPMPEIPDWYILEKSTKKIIIGMNQLDLWSGGHQLNRASKYIGNNQYNTDKMKLLCVVCNYVKLETTKNKTYKIFENGFENNTLCYLGNLGNIIVSYFN